MKISYLLFFYYCALIFTNFAVLSVRPSNSAQRYYFATHNEMVRFFQQPTTQGIVFSVKPTQFYADVYKIKTLDEAVMACVSKNVHDESALYKINKVSRRNLTKRRELHETPTISFETGVYNRQENAPVIDHNQPLSIQWKIIAPEGKESHDSREYDANPSQFQNIWSYPKNKLNFHGTLVERSDGKHSMQISLGDRDVCERGRESRNRMQERYQANRQRALHLMNTPPHLLLQEVKALHHEWMKWLIKNTKKRSCPVAERAALVLSLTPPVCEFSFEQTNIQEYNQSLKTHAFLYQETEALTKKLEARYWKLSSLFGVDKKHINELAHDYVMQVDRIAETFYQHYPSHRPPPFTAIHLSHDLDEAHPLRILRLDNQQVLSQVRTTWKQLHERASANNDIKQAMRYQQRNQALEESLQPGAQPYKYAADLPAHKPFTDEYADVFNECYGTPLDRQLHEELCATHDKIIFLQSEYADNIHVQTLSPVVHHFSALAKEQTNPLIAFDLSDMCHYLTVAAQGFVRATQVVACGVGKGVINFVEHNIELGQALATHPIDEIVIPLFKAGASLGKGLYHATSLAITDQEKFASQAGQIMSELATHVYNNPTDALACVVELLIPVGTSYAAKFKSVQGLKEILKTQKHIAQLLNTSSTLANKMTQSVQTVLSQASEFAAVGVEYGYAALEDIIQIASKEPELSIIGDLALLKKPPTNLGNAKKVPKIVSTINQTSIGQLAQKIRSLGRNLLDEMENFNGHTLRDHVSQTKQALINRAMSDKVNAATSFSDKKTAIDAVQKNLRNNAEKIAEWIKSNPSTSKVFEYQHEFEIGKGVLDGKKNCLGLLTKSRIVLKPDSTHMLGFIILTAFPIP